MVAPPAFATPLCLRTLLLVQGHAQPSTTWAESLNCNPDIESAALKAKLIAKPSRLKKSPHSKDSLAEAEFKRLMDHMDIKRNEMELIFHVLDEDTA